MEKLASRSGLGWDGKKKLYRISVMELDLGSGTFSFVGISALGTTDEWMDGQSGFQRVGMDGYMISPIADPAVFLSSIVHGLFPAHFSCFFFFFFSRCRVALEDFEGSFLDALLLLSHRLGLTRCSSLHASDSFFYLHCAFVVALLSSPVLSGGRTSCRGTHLNCGLWSNEPFCSFELHLLLPVIFECGDRDRGEERGGEVKGGVMAVWQIDPDYSGAWGCRMPLGA